MSRNIIFALMYHCYKLLDLIYKTYDSVLRKCTNLMQILFKKEANSSFNQILKWAPPAQKKV
jgi:hypothetical protein